MGAQSLAVSPVDYTHYSRVELLRRTVLRLERTLQVFIWGHKIQSLQDNNRQIDGHERVDDDGTKGPNRSHGDIV